MRAASVGDRGGHERHTKLVSSHAGGEVEVRPRERRPGHVDGVGKTIDSAVFLVPSAKTGHRDGLEMLELAPKASEKPKALPLVVRLAHLR